MFFSYLTKTVPVKWTAPEVLIGSPPTTKSDGK
jgi:hypothetical protein